MSQIRPVSDLRNKFPEIEGVVNRKYKYVIILFSKTRFKFILRLV